MENNYMQFGIIPYKCAFYSTLRYNGKHICLLNADLVKALLNIYFIK